MISAPRSAVLVPGYGGGASQPLILELSKALREAGLATRTAVLGRGGLEAGYPKQLAAVREARRELEPGPVALVGRSFGGRICAMLAAKEPPAALVVLGWPIRPPGKKRPMDEAALLSLRCRTLIFQGAKDELGPLRVLEPLAARNPQVELRVLPGVGHGFGRILERELARRTARWLCEAK